jgi:hypothetical protein
VVLTGADDSDTGLDEVLAAGDPLWLGLSVDTGAELAPRQRLGSGNGGGRGVQAVSAAAGGACPADGALGWDGADGELFVCAGTSWRLVPSAPNQPRSCRAIREGNPSAVTGVYTIDPDGPGVGVGPVSVTCDMAADGKGWTKVDLAFLLAGAQRADTGGTASESSGILRFYPSVRDTESWHDFDLGFTFERARGTYVVVPYSHPDDNAESACIANSTYTTRFTAGSGNVSWQRFGVPGKVLKTCGTLGGEYTSNRTVSITETTVPVGRVLRWSGGDETGAAGAELFGIRDVAIYVW